MKTIYFANHAQFEGRFTNLGDWAIFEQMMDALSEKIDLGHLRVLVSSADPEYTNANYPAKTFQRGGLRGIYNTIKCIAQSDVVLIGGGEIVQDLSSMVYIPYQLIKPFVAKLFGKKLFAYAIGVGEKEEISWIGKLQAKTVLNMFDIITVRDQKSYDILKGYLNVSKPMIYLTADPALNLKKQQKDTDEIFKGDYVVMSCRSVYHRVRSLLPFSVRKKLNLVPKEYYKEIEVFKNCMASIADYLICKYGMNVYFLNTYTGKSMSAMDDKFTLDIIGRMSCQDKDRIHTISSDLRPCEIKTVLSKAKMVVSVPLHPLILSAAEAVPSISFAYASKSWCFMEQVGLQNYINKVMYITDKVDLVRVQQQIDEIMNNYERITTSLKETVDNLKHLEKKNVQLLLALLAEL